MPISTSEPRCCHCGHSLVGLALRDESFLCPECGKHTLAREATEAIDSGSLTGVALRMALLAFLTSMAWVACAYLLTGIESNVGIAAASFIALAVLAIGVYRSAIWHACGVPRMGRRGAFVKAGVIAILSVVGWTVLVLGIVAALCTLVWTL